MELFHARDNAGTVLAFLRLVTGEQLPQITAAFCQQLLSYFVDFIDDRIIHRTSPLLGQQTLGIGSPDLTNESTANHGWVPPPAS